MDGDCSTSFCHTSFIVGLAVVSSFIITCYGLDDMNSLRFVNFCHVQWLCNSTAVPGEGDRECSLLHSAVENKIHTFGDYVALGFESQLWFGHSFWWV